MLFREPSMQTCTDVPLHVPDVPPAGGVHSVAFGTHRATPLESTAQVRFTREQSDRASKSSPSRLVQITAVSPSQLEPIAAQLFKDWQNAVSPCAKHVVPAGQGSSSVVYPPPIAGRHHTRVLPLQEAVLLSAQDPAAG